MRAFATLLLVAALPGCLGIEHHVRGVAMNGHGELAGIGVADATVTLICPGEASREARTTMGGRFALPLDDALDPSCEVAVSKPGYRSRRYPITELCAHAMTGDQECDGASLTAYLEPALVNPPLEPEEAEEGEAP